MFSSKTSRMLLEAQNHLYRGRRIIAFKPVIDDRFSPAEISTHSGMVSLPATRVETGNDIVSEVALHELADDEVRRTTIVVDELFMVPGAGDAVVWLHRLGFDVLASTLDLSSSMQPFHEVAIVLPWASRVEKCVAACAVCQGPARFTWKKTADDELIQVGGADLYEPRCATCHPSFGSVA